MEVHVMMRIDVIQGKSSLSERFKLCTDFRLQLLPHLRPKKEIYS